MKKRLLQEKVIAISGGSSGIGLAAAAECAKYGMHVHICSRSASPVLQDGISQKLKEIGAASVSFKTCDVTDEVTVSAWMKDIWQQHSRIDAIYANAGIGLFSPILETTKSKSAHLFDINFGGTMAMIHSATPYLRKTPHGLKHILICSSSASKTGVPHMGIYCASKASLDAMAIALRAELYDEGISVSTVHPIGTRTNFLDAAGSTANVNTPRFFIQDASVVGVAIRKCLQKPRAEVWTSSITRCLMICILVCPKLGGWLMLRHWQKIKAN